MSQRLSIIVAITLTFVGPRVWAQDSTAQRAAEGALLGAVEHTVSGYCFKAPEDDLTAITLDVEMLSPAALLSKTEEAPIGSPTQVGAYTYEGKGVRITSRDPRFGLLRVDPSTGLPSLPDGEHLAIGNLVWAPGGGQCRLSLIPPSQRGRSNRTVAEERGAHAQLAGHRSGASSPLGNDRFIGIMHPDQEDDRTVIVTFSAGPGHGTRVEAEVPLALQSIHVIPPLHGGDWSIFLLGRQGDGSIVQAILNSEVPVT